MFYLIPSSCLVSMSLSLSRLFQRSIYLKKINMRGGLEAARRKWVAVVIMTIYLKMVAENMMKTCEKDYQSQAKQTKSFVFHFGSTWLMCCNVQSYLTLFCTCPSLVLLITSLANERRDEGRLSLSSSGMDGKYNSLHLQIKAHLPLTQWEMSWKVGNFDCDMFPQIRVYHLWNDISLKHSLQITLNWKGFIYSSSMTN